MIVPRAGFLPAAACNYETLTQLTGLPSQVFGGLLATGLVAALGGYFLASWPADDARILKSRARYVSGTIASLIIILIGGWYFTQFMGNVAHEQLHKELTAKSKLIIQRLVLELEEAEAAVKAMSGSPWILPALTLPSPQALVQANSVLDQISIKVRGFSGISYGPQRQYYRLFESRGAG